MPSTAALPPLERELALASDAARRAGTIQMERYERLERIVHKSERDVVTEVDHLSEELILAAIRAEFPGDAILAEESGGHRLRRRGRADSTAGSGRVWLVDPLDGTVNYANGIPVFCVSIGLVVDGRPAVGVVYDPARDELFSATAGGGSLLDGEPITHPGKEKLSDCVISLALPGRGYSRRERRVRSAVRVTRVFGSAALALAYVGNGRFDAFVQPRGLSGWDIAAAGLIAQEGGAQVTDGHGGAWLDLARRKRSLGIVAAAPPHHSKLMELLQ